MFSSAIRTENLNLQCRVSGSARSICTDVKKPVLESIRLLALDLYVSSIPLVLPTPVAARSNA
jgi:hypothetical protein